MFIQSKYTIIYYNLINRAKGRIKLHGMETHHIIPRSLGGSDDVSNLVHLTPREHYISHRLLTKISIGNDAVKMHKAMWLMSNRAGIRLTSRVYATAKEAVGKWMIHNNPMYNPVNVQRYLSTKRTNGHDQSSVAIKRNEEYWADSNNRTKLTERNKKRTRDRGMVYRVINETSNDVRYYWYRQSVIDATNARPSTMDKYSRTGKLMYDKWRIKRIPIEMASSIPDDE